jgi:hypothetical protein
MSVSRSLVRLALLAYPAEYRAASGEELAGTALELAGRSTRSQLAELLGLVAGGVRERGRRATGGCARLAWSDGLRFAALLLLLVTAWVNLQEPSWDAAARVGAPWRQVAGPFLRGEGWLRWGAAVVLPLVGAWALSRGRLVLCAALSFVAALLFVAGELPFVALEYTQAGVDPASVLQAARLGDAVFLAAPGVLALAAWRPDRQPATLSRWWLAVPVLQGVLLSHFWLTTMTVWPVGLLLLAWLAAAHVDARLGVAAFATTLPALAVLVPTTIAGPRWDSALALTLGAAVCGALALARALDREPV